MKKILHLVAGLYLLCAVNKTNAQCDFKATIHPDKPIFCPGGSDTLSTQKYDSYQWFKNNKPIKGATGRSLIIHQEQDEGYLFKVVATKNTCTDTSKNVLADGYAFISPILIESGDIGVYDPTLDALVECPEDTLILTFPSFPENIQWYNFLRPIPGAHEESYNVTKTGSYTVCGAPSVCPDYIVCESLPLNAVFEYPKASITERNDTLFASSAQKYQWFFFKKRIPGATRSYYVPFIRGSYMVNTTDVYTCGATSAPYYFAPHQKDLILISPNPVKDVLHLHIYAADAKQVVIMDLYGTQKLRTIITGSDQNINVQNLKTGNYIIRVLNFKGQQVTSEIVVKQ